MIVDEFDALAIDLCKGLTVYQFRDDPWLKTHFMTKIFRFYTNLYKKIAFLNIKLDKKALKFVRFYSL
jgi:hypothetical protein